MAARGSSARSRASSAQQAAGQRLLALPSSARHGARTFRAIRARNDLFTRTVKPPLHPSAGPRRPGKAHALLLADDVLGARADVAASRTKRCEGERERSW